MKYFILISLLTVSSCSLFNDALNKSVTQEKMIVRLKEDPYRMSLKDLQNKVGEFIQRSEFEGTWVFVSQPGHQSQELMARIDEVMKDGFYYKGNLYTSEPDFDLLKVFDSKARSDVFKAKYHLIEESKESFTIVYGSTIFEGKSTKEGESILNAYKLTGVIRPVSIDFDWWKIIRGKGVAAGFTAAPVDFSMSRKYQEQDKPTEISFLYWLDEARAKKLEAELSKN